MAALKKTQVELDLLTDVDMLLMIEKGIGGRICNTIHHYAKANNKYMSDYDKNKEFSYLNYWDVNNLYDWVMSQELPTYNFEWVEDTSQFNKVFIKNYDEKSEVGYILEVDVQYLEKFFELHNDLPFLPERKKLGKVEKRVTRLEDKSEYVVHVKSLQQALNHGLILKKVHRVISLNQDEWLKPYLEMNNKLRKKAKSDFEKNFFELMNNSVLGKTMENVRKYKNLKLVTTERRKNYLVSEPNYHSKNFFTDNFFTIEMKKTQITMNKPFHLGLLILDISKTQHKCMIFGMIFRKMLKQDSKHQTIM